MLFNDRVIRMVSFLKVAVWLLVILNISSCSAGNCNTNCVLPNASDKPLLPLEVPFTNSFAIAADLGEHNYPLIIRNNTNTKLNLIRVESGLIKNGVESNASVFSRLDGCTALSPHSECNFNFTPSLVAKSSALFSAEYQGADGKIYHVSRILNAIKESMINGFYVRNKELVNIRSNNIYTLAIPFIAGVDIKNLQVNFNEFTPVDYNIKCEDGKPINSVSVLHAGVACMLFAKFEPHFGPSSIKVVGSHNGQPVSFTVNIDSGVGEIPVLNMSSEDLLFKTSEVSSVGSLFLINSGKESATEITQSFAKFSSRISEMKYKCNGTNVANLPSAMEIGDFCLITFLVDQAPGSEANTYSISYYRKGNIAKPNVIATGLYFYNNDVLGIR